MSSDEKKYSLNELPDEGSSPSPAPRVKIKSTPSDPRIEALKERPPVQKVEVMLQRWHFDEKVRNYSWVPITLILLVLEFTPFYRAYLRELDLLNAAFFDTGGDIVRDFTFVLERFIRHPILLGLLIPFFSSFSKTSDYSFDITFDGLDSVKQVLPMGSREQVSRVFVKWSEIERVEKVKVDEREVLRVFSPEGPVADIIWYIDLSKKKAIRHLLQGLVSKQHPLRAFLEKEKEPK